MKFEDSASNGTQVIEQRRTDVRRTGQKSNTPPQGGGALLSAHCFFFSEITSEKKTLKKRFVNAQLF